MHGQIRRRIQTIPKTMFATQFGINMAWIMKITRAVNYNFGTKLQWKRTVFTISTVIEIIQMNQLNGRPKLIFLNSPLTDLLGLHRVENASHTDSAVSLHLYCPPYDSCSVFNEKTGKKTRCSVEFYSINGQKKKNDEIPYRQEDH